MIPFLNVTGMLVGQNASVLSVIDFRLIENESLISFFGRIGVLFLLFHLGLEISMKKRIKSGRSITIGGTIYILINLSLRLLYGFIIGFLLPEILIIAGVIPISFSAIVAEY